MPDAEAGGKAEGGGKRRRRSRPGRPRTAKEKREKREKKRERPNKAEKKRQRAEFVEHGGDDDGGGDGAGKETGTRGEGKHKAPREKKERKQKTVEDVVVPEDDPVEMQHRVFVGGLGKDFKEEDVRIHFQKCGRITRVDIPKSDKGDLRGFAFVRFRKESQVAKALELNGSTFKGKAIFVKPAKRENPKLRVLVGNLPFDADKATLRKDWSECGEINGFKFLRYEEKFKSAVFITYATADAVKAALKFDHTEYGGAKIRVRLVEPRKEAEQRKADKAKGGGKGKKGDGGHQKAQKKRQAEAGEDESEPEDATTKAERKRLRLAQREAARAPAASDPPRRPKAKPRPEPEEDDDDSS